jgi:hypothetical protein
MKKLPTIILKILSKLSYLVKYLWYLIKFLWFLLKRLFKNPKLRLASILIVLLALTSWFSSSAIFKYLSTPKAPPLRQAPASSPFLFNADTGGTRPGSFKALIGEKSSNSPKVEISFAQKTTASFVLKDLNLNLQKPVQEGNKLIFANVRDQVDITYQLLPNGVKEEIVIKEKINDNAFTFVLNSPNAIPKKSISGDFSPYFYDTTGAYIFNFAKPFAYDSNGARTENVAYKIKQLGTAGDYQITVVVDDKWLSDKARSYPIYIDPTIVHDTTAEFAPGQLNRVVDTGSGASPSATTNYQELSSDINTVGLWHMNETSGNALDSSGNGNTGTPTGTTIVDGRLGKARSFNGTTSDYINLGNIFDFSGTKPFTIEAWVYTNTVGTQRAIIGKFNANVAGQWYLRMDTTGKITFHREATPYIVTSNTVLATSKWYHVAAVYDGAYNRIYINGVEDASPVTTGSVTSNSTNVLIGSYYNSNAIAYNWDGYIDEMRVSNIARTPEEIKMSASRRPYSVYTSDVIDMTNATSWNPLTWTELGVTTGDGETPFSSTGLVAQWNFNDTPSTATAVSGGSCGASCNGTLTNFSNTTAYDAVAGSGWTSANRRWGAGALMFDGTDDFVNLGDNAALQPAGSVSVESWFQSTSASNSTLVRKRLYGYSLSINAGILTFSINNSAATPFNAISPKKYNDGNWHHVVGIYNGTSVSLYVDGILINTASAGTIYYTAGAVAIGRDGDNPALYFKGIIDSTRIYSRALTASEILSNYQAGNIELQTRVGATTDANDGTWEAWKPTSVETAIDSLDANYSTVASGCTAVGATTPDGGNTYIFTKPKSTYYFTGADQTYTVPVGVTSIQIYMWGGGGGGGAPGGWTYGFAGGGGGYTTGILAVTPGQKINLIVGAGGTNGSISNTNPNFGGGARSCNSGGDCRYGGQGGGRSAIRINGVEILTAGGGGGGGASRVTNGQQGGGGGGSNGVQGSSYTAAAGGGAGTQSAGGAGGAGGSAGGAGTQFAGGNPGTAGYGGSGGGGYYGGGGGAYTEPNDMGGGGGGSGYIGGSGVSGASTTAASGSTQAGGSTLNLNAGAGGAASVNGSPGKIIIRPIVGAPASLTCTSGGNVEVLVVAGGMDMGGGGGGGGVIYNSAYSISANTPVSITVGSGGAGAPAAGTYKQPSAAQYLYGAANGDNSIFGSLTAIGGGAGGSSYYSWTPGASGYAGGSGGGSSGYSDTSIKTGGAGTAGQGSSGGQGGGQYYSGGGGGAGGPGTNSTAISHGGIGYLSDILGTNYYWGGGGGGSGYTICGGNGGPGGGGGGAVCNTSGGSGLNPGDPGGGGTTVAVTNKPGGNGGESTGGGGGGGSH